MIGRLFGYSYFCYSSSVSFGDKYMSIYETPKIQIYLHGSTETSLAYIEVQRRHVQEMMKGC